MKEKDIELLKNKCSRENYKKLEILNNEKVFDFIIKYVKHCSPSSVFVCTDSQEDALYIRNKAVENGEETKLAKKGHTVHFDGMLDQGRDKGSTKYMISKAVDFGPDIETIERSEGYAEINDNLKDSMEGNEMYVAFFCLGPLNSDFSTLCVQITDSSYVIHSENILYRTGYEEFKKRENFDDFFRFVHSAGVLENKVSKNVNKKRIYIDLEDNIIFSTNTQYAGNTVGLKKLALRLAIQKASREGWLAEHMFVMGVNGAGGRVTYFTGAFPSACGKTSTAMLAKEKIIGDDIAYLKNKNGKVHAVNVECGIFGIIQDVNPKDDPLIWDVVNSPGELIISNVLVTEEGEPFWLGDGRQSPKEGINYSGKWVKGKKDAKGNIISYAHKNARYTISISRLKNRDVKIDDPEGVVVGGILYGVRDSNTSVPVQESFDWNHGVLTMGASLESETTAATLGQEGVRKFNIMANLDFLSIPIATYINNYLDFGKKLDECPSVFLVNYFLKNKEGRYITGKEDKHVWIKWMEMRVHKEVDAIKTPTGYIPQFIDLKKLFKDVLNKDYTKEQYIEQFTLRIPENIDKIKRIINIYKTQVQDTPDILFKILEEQKQSLEELMRASEPYLSPFIMANGSANR